MSVGVLSVKSAYSLPQQGQHGPVQLSHAAREEITSRSKEAMGTLLYNISHRERFECTAAPFLKLATDRHCVLRTAMARSLGQQGHPIAGALSAEGA